MADSQTNPAFPKPDNNHTTTVHLNLKQADRHTPTCLTVHIKHLGPFSPPRQLLGFCVNVPPLPGYEKSLYLLCCDV
ncbi:unnamed protein product [Callosobruchus maculatus]|uniref:Uncharacterized protein n=1 Tax=Callosobruchus maculatus TaxID=64391 RepID=A0A653BKK5_CALMS|nr:unnamed protein product [Callosobruchus maculatus]